MHVESGFITFLLFLIDILITMSRTGLLNARPLRMAMWRDRYPGRVEKALELYEHPRLRPSLRLIRIFTRLFIAGWVTIAAQSFVPEAWVLLAQMLALFLSTSFIFISELVIEKFIMQDPERWALRMLWFGQFVVTLLAPFVWPLSLMRLQTVDAPSPVTEDEIKTWVQSEPVEGGLDREERQMIYSIFQFGDTIVREIMVPRLDMQALEMHTELRVAAKALLDAGHSRVPVYKDTLDNVVGLLYAKDLLKVMGLPAEKTTSLVDLLRSAYFVPETKRANALLTEMQSQRIHMALVVDEYGSVVGLVTLEDILEEITGEIRDEYDAGEDIPYQQIAPTEYIFKGGIDLDEFNDVIGSSLSKVESDTLAGFIYDQLGRIPAGGESIQMDGMKLTVEQVIGRRIRRVRAQRILDGEKNDHISN